jgi:citrate lyase subunit beta/citryl-CoA lyase
MDTHDANSMSLSSCMIRSKLFVPGNRPDYFEKAAGSAADALSFDLEDAVADSKKSEARANVASFLERKPAGFEKIVIVRVNPVASGLFERDLDAIVGPGLDVINIPKVESHDDISRAIAIIANAERARGLRSRIGVLANIETPKGLRLAHEIGTADQRLIGLQIGFKDLLVRWGIEGADPVAQQFVRLKVRLAAAEGGIAVYDGAFSDVKGIEGFRVEAENARRMGFAGKSCIHPSQISIANEVFTPSAEEISFAARVLDAARSAATQGRGVFTVDGQMIDAPMIARARAVAGLAARLSRGS